MGAENALTKVKAVTLDIGEVSGVVPGFLTDSWKWATEKSELLKGSELKIEQIDAVTFCESCQQTYATIPQGKICPHCQSDKTYLVTGNEVNIKEIEAQYRFAQFMKAGVSTASGTTLSYSDASSIASWAQTTALYCQETGIITGRDGG